MTQNIEKQHININKMRIGKKNSLKKKEYDKMKYIHEYKTNENDTKY
jgi:hypothetical protein